MRFVARRKQVCCSEKTPGQVMQFAASGGSRIAGCPAFSGLTDASGLSGRELSGWHPASESAGMSLLAFTGLRRRRSPLIPQTYATRGARPARTRRRRRRWGRVLVVIATFLVLVRFVGSPIAKSVVNRELATIDGFAGRMDAVTLALWRGAIDVENFVLYERGHESDVPVVHVRKASLRLSPSALLAGRFGGSAIVDGAEITVVKRHKNPEEDAPSEFNAELQRKRREVKRWQDVFRSSFPMELNKLEVKNTRVRFIDRSENPAAEIGVENLHIVASDLQNRPKANGDPLPAKVRIAGTTTGNGQLRSEIQVNPIAEEPTFTARLEVRGVELPAANDFLGAYAGVDVSRGTFEMFFEVEAGGGAYHGYVKPLFRDLEFETANDDEKNVLERAKEKVVSAVAAVLENNQEEQVATRAPFNGNFADNEVDIWSTIGTLFRNAFVQALRGGFER